MRTNVRRIAHRATTVLSAASARASSSVPSATLAKSRSTSPSTSSVRHLARVSSHATRTRSFASSADDTHDDFKPKVNSANAGDIKDVIEGDVKANEVLIYMKGSPSAPQCGFSNMACRILDHHGVDYASRNVLASDELRNGIKEFSAWPTIPQLYVKGEFVGGSDIMMNMHQSGELADLFKDVKKRA